MANAPQKPAQPGLSPAVSAIVIIAAVIVIGLIGWYFLLKPTAAPMPPGMKGGGMKGGPGGMMKGGAPGAMKGALPGAPKGP
jgi:hypothetical protein